MFRDDWRWCYDDFCRFYELLTLADGGAAGLEGFHRLMLREVFRGDARDRVWRSGQEGPGELTEGLVLIPKGHAKTTLMAGLGVYHCLVVPNANVYVGAADKIQAGELYRFAAHFIESESEINAELKVLRGTLEIRSRVDQGFMRIIASDDSKQGGKRQGFNPTAAFLDELHAHENDNLYTDMRSGLFKRNGLLMTITTAGWDQEGALGQLRRSFLECDQSGGSVDRMMQASVDGSVAPDPLGRLTIARKASGKSVMLEWACAAGDDLDDMAVVKLANPASWVTTQSLEDARESLTPWNFQRYRCNRWTLGFESWLPHGAWDALAEPGLALDPALPLYGAVDMARYRDCAALVAVQPRPDQPAAVRAWIWKPGGPDDPVPYQVVMDAIRDLHRDFSLRACTCDPRWFDQAAEELRGEGVPMEVTPQSNERMSVAAGNLRQAILEGKLAHDGDPVLAAHVMAAIAKDVGPDRFKLDKPKTSAPPIDAAEALSMAWALADSPPPTPGVGFW